MALIAAISRGHSPALIALTSSHSCDIRRALTSPQFCHIWRALTSPHSCDIRKAFPVSFPLCLQPATHLLSDSTPLVLAVVIPQNMPPPLIMASPPCHDSPPPHKVLHSELECCVCQDFTCVSVWQLFHYTCKISLSIRQSSSRQPLTWSIGKLEHHQLHQYHRLTNKMHFVIYEIKLYAL